MDKEITASSVGKSDKVQLFTNESSINYVKAIKTSSVALDSVYTGQINQFVDGYKARIHVGGEAQTSSDWPLPRNHCGGLSFGAYFLSVNPK
jgi:hypothetical protein